MCGRYIQSSELAILRERFGFTSLLTAPPVPRYNISPRQRAPVVAREGAERALLAPEWGLLPSWAKDTAKAPRPINARAETLGEKAAFRGPLARRRCLVLADGYYEWRAGARGKTPFAFRLVPARPFAFAGLWDENRHAGGEPLATFVIVTTAANPLGASVHERMPAILDAEGEALWLCGRPLSPAELARCLGPYQAGEMACWEVSRLVNDPTRDGPELLGEATGEPLPR